MPYGLERDTAVMPEPAWNPAYVKHSCTEEHEHKAHSRMTLCLYSRCHAETLVLPLDVTPIRRGAGTFPSACCLGEPGCVVEGCLPLYWVACSGYGDERDFCGGEASEA